MLWPQIVQVPLNDSFLYFLPSPDSQRPKPGAPDSQRPKSGAQAMGISKSSKGITVRPPLSKGKHVIAADMSRRGNALPNHHKPIGNHLASPRSAIKLR